MTAARPSSCGSVERRLTAGEAYVPTYLRIVEEIVEGTAAQWRG